MIHISEMSQEGQKIKKVKNVLHQDSVVHAKIIAINDRGQISLSLKNVNRK